MNGLVDIIITDITAGQRNWCFAEIGPHRINPLYGMQYGSLAKLFCVMAYNGVYTYIL